MDDDLINEVCVEALLGDGRTKEHHALASCGRECEGNGLGNAIGNERDRRVRGAGWGSMSEDEHGPGPCAAVDPLNTVPSRDGQVIPAPAGKDGARGLHDVVDDRIGILVFEDPVHGVVRPGDEAVQRHRHVPDHVAHAPDLPCDRERRCASRVKCAIATSGTKNDGINANGRRCISAVFVPVVNPGQRYSMPRRTASTKSAMPKRFQTRNVLPKRNPSSAATRATTQGAVAAMTISPRPAGQAKPPGNIPSAYAIRNPRPMNLQPLRAIKNTGGTETTRARQREDTPKPNTKNRIGTRKASASMRGSSFGRVTNTPRAASNTAAPNQSMAPQNNGMCLSLIRAF